MASTPLVDDLRSGDSQTLGDLVRSD